MRIAGSVIGVSRGAFSAFPAWTDVGRSEAEDASRASPCVVSPGVT